MILSCCSQNFSRDVCRVSSSILSMILTQIPWNRESSWYAYRSFIRGPSWDFSQDSSKDLFWDDSPRTIPEHDIFTKYYRYVCEDYFMWRKEILRCYCKLFIMEKCATRCRRISSTHKTKMEFFFRRDPELIGNRAQTHSAIRSNKSERASKKKEKFWRQIYIFNRVQ